VRVFRGTRIDRELQARVRSSAAAAVEPDNCWQELSARIHELAAWVAEAAGLREHQRRLVATTGSYDLADEAIRPNSGLLLAHGPLHGSFEVSEEHPPIPSVLLFEEELAPAFPAVLTLTPPDADGGPAGSAEETLQVEARVRREVRLAIGPADALAQPSPLFEVRTRVDLVAGKEALAVRRPWLFMRTRTFGCGPEESPGAGVEDVEIQIGDAWRSGSVELGPRASDGRRWEELLAWPDFNGPGDPLQPEHGYAAWRLVTPELCAELLDTPPAWDGAVRFWLPFPPLRLPTLAPEGSIGAWVEAALVAEDGPRLDRALLEDARRLVALVKDHEARRKAEALALHERASVRWSALGSEAD
jgi:hypothetical protein